MQGGGGEGPPYFSASKHYFSYDCGKLQDFCFIFTNFGGPHANRAAGGWGKIFGWFARATSRPSEKKSENSPV